MTAVEPGRTSDTIVLYIGADSSVMPDVNINETHDSSSETKKKTSSEWNFLAFADDYANGYSRSSISSAKRNCRSTYLNTLLPTVTLSIL